MNLWADRTAKAELGRLLKGQPNFQVHFSESQVAASLWEYGEATLTEQALGTSPRELVDIRAIAASYEDPD